MTTYVYPKVHTGLDVNAGRSNMGKDVTVSAICNNLLFSICCKFVLAFFLKFGFYLEGRPQKERLKNIFSSLKIKCVRVIRKLISSLRSSLLLFSPELSLLALSVHPLSFT
jgi:hypothetical protein